jgi:3-hydroxyisobutyrate dehydrogenase-like beta-hydroxyacid dehydrogenase
VLAGSSDRRYRVGDRPAWPAMKLANNFSRDGARAATSEASRLARRRVLDMATMLEG